MLAPTTDLFSRACQLRRALSFANAELMIGPSCLHWQLAKDTERAPPR